MTARVPLPADERMRARRSRTADARAPRPVGAGALVRENCDQTFATSISTTAHDSGGSCTESFEPSIATSRSGTSPTAS